MSTLKVSEIRNASSASGGLSIAADGVVSGALPSPNRNLLYNGAMQVAQRGTSTASITSLDYFTVDRWAFGGGTQGVWTMSVESDAPTGSGFHKSAKVLCTTADASPAAGDFLLFEQRLEGQDLQRVAKGTSSAQQLMLSFWVKANVTGTYVIELNDTDNNRSVSASYTISSSATWERKTITFPADTTGAFDNDNAGSLRVLYWLGAGSNFTSGTLQTAWGAQTTANRAPGQTNLAAATNNYWQVTGVQLEVGDTATPFEFKSYGQELRECQRYYQVSLATGSAGLGMATSAPAANVVFHFQQTMRAAPTITLQAAGGGANQAVFLTNNGSIPVTVGTNVADEITADRFRVAGSGYTGAFTAGNGSVFWTNTTNGAIYRASAEL